MKKYILVCLMLNSMGAVAQIPNAGFEAWDSSAGYKVPLSWGNFDSLTNCLPSPVNTCEEGGAGFSGAHFLKLSSKTTVVGIAPGMAVSGRISPTTFMPVSGYAFSSRPATLDGLWQYAGATGDTGFVGVFLSKWNSMTQLRDTVAYVVRYLNGTVSSPTVFSVPITYYTSATPDSAMIVLSASGPNPVSGSYLYIDSLSFNGTATAVRQVEISAGTLRLYPNPARDILSIDCGGMQGELSVEIVDMSGRVAMTQKLNNKVNTRLLDVSRLIRGVYVVRVSDERTMYEGKIILE